FVASSMYGDGMNDEGSPPMSAVPFALLATIEDTSVSIGGVASVAVGGLVGPFDTRIPPVRVAGAEFPLSVELAIMAATLAWMLIAPPFWLATLPETVESR